MTFIKMFAFFCFTLLCLLDAKDEMVEIENSIREGEFTMEESIVAQGILDEQAEAVYQIYEDGDIALANSLGEIALCREQAYALLDVLYRHVDTLRQREDTVPLEMPEWAQPE